ncbi:hypothetical protein B0T09DRAFT_368025 [Sordaria sp. MPI-SDFR-AT-0083]|nr:hypothetical protein B0T09DRAFT_368025 [Sordaria sp. MPI-SDFR-AT-0083]
MKLPPNIPTALILTFLFSLQVPLRLAAPLSHDKLFPNSEPIVPLTLPQQQIRYERIDNGRIGTRRTSNPKSNRDFFPSPLPDSLAVGPGSTGSPVYPPGRLLGRLQKRSAGGGNLDSNSNSKPNSSWDTAAASAVVTITQLSQLSQLNQLKRGTKLPPSNPSSRISSRPGRNPHKPLELKHLFAHSYHSATGRGVLTESADDDLNLFSNDGLAPQSLLKMMTFEPTITINSTSIERRGPGAWLGPGAGSYLAAMSIGGATPRPRSRSGEASSWERMERRAGGWEGDDSESERGSADESEGKTGLPRYIYITGR